MHELREKVARSVYETYEKRPIYAQGQMCGPLSEEIADAAIRAVFDHLMEPSDAVWFATAPVLSGSTGYIEREDFIEAYQAMLTKAKEEAGL